MEYFNLILSALTLIVVTTSVIVAYNTVKKNHEWNRRKSTQDILSELVLGDYPRLSKLLIDKGVKPFEENETYNHSIEKLEEKDKKLINDTVKRIFNIFEFISINIKNNTIDEQICYDYLGWMYTEYYRWGETLVRDLQDIGPDKRILGNFQKTAKEWKIRIEKERTPENIKGKNKL